MIHYKHKECGVRVHSICQIDWLKQHSLEVNYDDTIFFRQHNESYQNYVRLRSRQYHA
jgi:hypothetical protein